MKCFYFGCWNEPGHYFFGPGGARPARADYAAEYYVGRGGTRQHLDSTLAPRIHPYGGLCYSGGAVDADELQRIRYAEERPQGQFLLHVLSNGFTAIQWWDRHQGDKRSACNSTILLEGTHTADEMIQALCQNFANVKARLNMAGVDLVDVTSELKK